MPTTEVRTGPLPPDVEESRSTSLAQVDDAPGARTIAARNDSGPVSPAQLIQFAIENKLPAAELKELVGLHEQMENRAARRAFFDALREFQRACPPIKKNKTANIATKSGGSFSYSYAELDEIERHVKPHLEANDFAYSFDTTVDDKGALLTNICTLRHVLGHAEQSRFTLPTSSESAMTAQQRFSAANNFAKRQTLAAVLGISITNKEVPDSEIDPTTITDDQVTQIDDLINETHADRARFLKLFDAKTVADIRAADYARAVALLEEKKSRMRT